VLLSSLDQDLNSYWMLVWAVVMMLKIDTLLRATSPGT
jgi:hypothetical protein